MDTTKILQGKLAAKYELAPHIKTARVNFGGRFGTINFETLTEKQAERLIKMGFKGLKRKPKAAKAKKAEATG